MNTTVISANEDMLNKVPQLTIYFWIIKIMATTVGETVADLLAVKLNFGLVVARLAGRGGAATDRVVCPVANAQVHTRYLLGCRGAHQRRRHAHHRQPGRQLSTAIEYGYSF